MIEITEKEFKQLTEFIKSNYGINLKEEKKMLVSGRLQNVLIENGFRTFTEYYEYIKEDRSGKAVITLIDKITTNHTFFMREEDHFYYLKDRVLPELSKKIQDKDMRIWCAASSSGEEPYTLAMVLDEFFGKEKLWWDTKILATDISNHVLDLATKGIYSSERITPLPLHWKQNYFKQKDKDSWEVKDKLKNEVIFRKFNLMEPIFPFKKKFHVIFCRNVMIYFDMETKNKLINKFYDYLEVGGYLFIGHSESINRLDRKFETVMPSVYRKV